MNADQPATVPSRTPKLIGLAPTAQLAQPDARSDNPYPTNPPPRPTASTVNARRPAGGEVDWCATLGVRCRLASGRWVVAVMGLRSGTYRRIYDAR